MPVHALPNEILIGIFLYHNALYSESQSIPRRPYACDGARLMLVCRYWRRLAVSTPCLWQATKIRRNTEWFKLVLSRSENLPLDLVFHQPTAILPIVNCLVLLKSHIYRLRSMLISTIKVMKRLLEIVSRLNMPLLSDLDVVAKSNARLELSPELLPALRSLRLSSCAIPWIPTMLTKLRRLDLEDCTCRDRSITFEQLSVVLSECVELHELRLHNFLSAFQGPSTTARANRGPLASISITFPRLRELNIHDRPHLLSQFLSYVRLNHNTNVHIVGYIPDATVDIRDAFLSLLPQDSSGLPLLRMVTFAEIQNCQYLDCELVGYMRWPYVGPTITLGLELGDDLPTWKFYFESALREFAAIFSRAPLDHLHIFGDYNRVRRLDAWARLFTAFPNIQHLELEGEHPPLSVIGALGQPPYDESGLDVDGKSVTEGDIMVVAGVGDALVLPGLRSLDLQSVDWCPGLIETTVTVLQRRVAAGLPKLEELRLSLGETGDERGLRRTMKVYRRQLVSLVEELEDSFSD